MDGPAGALALAHTRRCPPRHQARELLRPRPRTRPGVTIKVLDFGIAKVMQGPTAEALKSTGTQLSSFNPSDADRFRDMAEFWAALAAAIHSAPASHLRTAAPIPRRSLVAPPSSSTVSGTSFARSSPPLAEFTTSVRSPRPPATVRRAPHRTLSRRGTLRPAVGVRGSQVDGPATGQRPRVRDTRSGALLFMGRLSEPAG